MSEAPRPDASGPCTFAEFWPHYVRAHLHPATRAFHCVATLAGWTTLAAALVTQQWWLIPVALLAPYPVVWFSHFFIEHNKPATFGHPGWSWLADQKMVRLILTGRMGNEVRRVTGQA